MFSAPIFRELTRTRRIITLDLVGPGFFSDVTGHSLCTRLQCERFGRGLPTPEDLQNLPTNRILKLLARNNRLCESDIPTTDSTLRAALGNCYRNGWVHKTLVDPTSQYETIHYVFPSPLHAWHAQRLLIPQTPSPVSTDLVTPLALCLAVIRHFNPAQLSSAPRLSRTPRESQYGFEFYRSLYKLTNGHVLPAPEFGTAARGSGMIDFLLPANRWGVELTRDGTEVAEHYTRFEAGGRYARWIAEGQVQDWVLLDFRTTLPGGVGKPGSFHFSIWNVVQAQSKCRYAEIVSRVFHEGICGGQSLG